MILICFRIVKFAATKIVAKRLLFSMSKYKEYKQLNLPEIASEVLNKWEEENTFQQSIDSREDGSSFVFYEGPPLPMDCQVFTM